jgi:branched-chain amino acid aminotransferase
MNWFSTTWTWLDGKWLEGNPPIMGPRTHASWLGSSVFDGARAFEGVMPDIEAHARRVNESAAKLGLKATMEADEIVALAREGARRFAGGSALYIKPMYWGEAEGPGTISADPESTRFCLCLFEAAMPEPSGFSLGVSRFRRPTLETMPTDVKTGALYPNNARAMKDAQARGFGNALVLDMLGNVAETATSNIFIVKEGAVVSPAPNGTFLNGITRQRTIALLRAEGYTVLEQRVTLEDVLGADEVFSTGNYGKVQPCNRVEDRTFTIGPVFTKARELYWAFAHDKR